MTCAGWPVHSVTISYAWAVGGLQRRNVHLQHAPAARGSRFGRCLAFLEREMTGRGWGLGVMVVIDGRSGLG